MVNNESHQVRQSAAGTAAPTCHYTVSTTSITPGAAGETGILNIIAPEGCPWTATSSDTWITVRPTSGSGNGSVDVMIAANSGAARTGFMTVAGKRIDVRQEAR